MAEEDQKKKKIKRKFGQIKSGNPDHKSDKQLYTIKNVKNLWLKAKNYNYLIATQKLDLKPFINQNKIKLKEKDLKY